MKHAWLGFFMYVVRVLKGKSDYFDGGGLRGGGGVGLSSNNCSYPYHFGC